MSQPKSAHAQDPDRWVYDGAKLIGAVKELASGGVEVFTADISGELHYRSKASNLREGVALVHAARAGRAAGGRQRD